MEAFHHHMALAAREARVRRLLVDEVWPQVSAEVRGAPMSRAERAALLGYGPDGV